MKTQLTGVGINLLKLLGLMSLKRGLPGKQLRRLRQVALVAFFLIPILGPATEAVALPAAPTAAVNAAVAPAATQVTITGEIERITLDTPKDVWSGGTIVVGGQNVTVPRNLLIDFPANRLTLQQTFEDAPAACAARGESGLSKADVCNTSGTGAIATIAANRTRGGNVIVGDMFFQKGIEVVTGAVTFMDYAGGYFRLNGNLNDPTTGIMVRLNDPSGRHTVQRGVGCAGGPNCSPDPRFMLDPDNYTNVFTTGYPVCIPSTVSRSFVDVLDLNNNGNKAERLTAQSAADGTGDLLCPHTNRTTLVADDSRRLAPIQLGDHLTAEGNFETINGVRFLSAWGTNVSRALMTKNQPGQPDYMFLDEVFIDGPGFQNQRVRTLFIGFATQVNPDILVWSLHRDPATNDAHEFPLASNRGCDAIGGGCTIGAGMFKIRHDVDFAAGTKPKLSPCQHLRADPRFRALNVCPGGGSLVEDFGVLSPIPHEIQARSGLKVADLNRAGGPVLRTLDIKGDDATNGQYLFPFGIGLGGIDIPNFFEININLVDTPYMFSGIPWNLDRRVGPGGCAGPCESTAQPLDPFPFEGVDPRTQAAGTIAGGAGTPTGSYSDPNFTASTLSVANNRIMSFVDPGRGNFDGDRTVLAWPPVDPPAQEIKPTPRLGASVPGAPIGVSAVAGKASAIVSWTAPVSDGGSPITSYTVTSSPGGLTASADGGATSATVTGLTNGTGYTFSVTANNAIGVSTESAPSTSVTPTAVAAPPLGVSPRGGIYNGPRAVTLSSEPGAAIYYNLNSAADPTPAGTRYTGSINISADTTLKAIAVDAGGNSSAVRTETYRFDSVPPTVSASPGGGTYRAARSVALSASEPGSIYYTLDGSTPSAASKLYSGPVNISTDTTLQFIAFDAAGNQSPVRTETYKFDSVAPTASATPAGGLFKSAQAVTLSTNEAGSIRYTLDGSAPTATSTLYTRPLNIGTEGATTLKYLAVDTAGNQSSIGSQIYRIDTVAPRVSVPLHSVVSGSQLGTSAIPVRLTWSGGDGGSGIASYQLQRSTSGGVYVNVGLPTAGATSLSNDMLTPGRSYRFRVRAIDRAGNASGYAFGTAFTPTAVQESGASYTGVWTQGKLTNAYGGSVRQTSLAGGRASFTFTGRSVMWVVPVNVNRGKAQVLVDGVAVTTVDLYSASARDRQVVFVRNFGAVGKHTLQVKALGTKRAASKGVRVDVDAFVVMR